MFEIRKIKKDKWLIILLVGLLLVVIAMPASAASVKCRTGKR